MSSVASFIVGWQEWVALPGLGLPAIKAKIDTGARSSALHAFLIEPFGPASQPMIRFGIHPIPGRLDVEIFCSAAIVDRRDVTSSNGERETRYFIRTDVELGGRAWPIEIGLTNRQSMSYRMLLGRQAIRDDMMIDPAGSFRQPLLSYRLYRNVPRRKQILRPLRIAVVARGPDAQFNRKLMATAAERGHFLELLDLERLQPTFAASGPGLSSDEVPLAHHDAVIPRIGMNDGALGAAIVRQLELMGGVSLNPGDALDRVANRYATLQALARNDVGQDLSWSAVSSGKGDPKAALRQSFLRVLVVGDKAVAVMRCIGDRRLDDGLARHRAERRLAERAAAALDLGLAAVDIDDGGGRPLVVAVSPKPALGRFAHVCDADVADSVIDLAESRVRSAGARAADGD